MFGLHCIINFYLFISTLNPQALIWPHMASYVNDPRPRPPKIQLHPQFTLAYIDALFFMTFFDYF